MVSSPTPTTISSAVPPKKKGTLKALRTKNGNRATMQRNTAPGMVTRVSNPQDRRGLVVRLTARGHDALNDLVAHPQASVYRALLEMPSAQLAALSKLLRGLLIRLESEGEGLPY